MSNPTQQHTNPNAKAKAKGTFGATICSASAPKITGGGGVNIVAALA